MRWLRNWTVELVIGPGCTCNQKKLTAHQIRFLLRKASTQSGFQQQLNALLPGYWDAHACQFWGCEFRS
ncbi:unnamed protein product [Cladocopium goreaui]|uniref:Uncharacterized protein n=1 Tax=Cladocopium goreaui TaxID=2562237 RepID=A0A9P1DBE3_9DINO|nr:unnamed protein product [Cladocopium goreaui]